MVTGPVSVRIPVSSFQQRSIVHGDTAAAAVHQPTAAGEKRRQSSQSHNRVLAYFVLGIIICWTPNHLYL
ncbi:hypothetical protein BV898_19058 [Hypsibius exemplaris]|uniref:Uncharacterized protein n=1 Tax=Hypsibius exemplaris TaxID=2072580 RepID=A0A9X6NK43_HYPEX|nr:hypothetical protein BV898_19058 [Hypsibius exemplaris]